MNQSLSEALQQFVNSSRYPFLKTLQVGRFVKASAVPLGVVSDLTFEKLVEFGTKKLTKLKWLDDTQQESLAELLRALADGEAVEALDVPRAGTLDVPRAKVSKLQRVAEERFVSSAEAENKLRAALAKLRNLSDFESLKYKSLGEFWNDDWPRSPFEEAMTLGQLIEMDLTTLWKKRSMNSARLDRMAKAAERAIDSKSPSHSTKSPLSLVQPIREEPLGKTPNVAPDPTFTDFSNHHWRGEIAALPALTQVAIESFLRAAHTRVAYPSRSQELLTLIVDTLTVSDFVTLLNIEIPLKSRTPSMTLLLASPDFNRAVLPITLALQSPGVHISRLVHLFDVNDHLSTALLELGIIVSVRLLGAEQVSLKKGRSKREICSQVWSVNNDLTEDLYRRLKSAKKVSKELAIDPALKTWLIGQ